MSGGSGSNEPFSQSGTAYPTEQFRRALEAAVRHEDPELRRRAEKRALAWEAVLTGIGTGTLKIGSRTPVKDTPAWVTLEVAHGGFVTGQYLAEGPLQPWEAELLASLPSDFNRKLGARHRLNTWFLTDEGLAQLETRLTDRTYALDVPEEGALLVVAWLMRNGFGAAALDLVTNLEPLADRLRFYPRPTDRPIIGGAVVHLHTAGEVAERLQQTEVREQIAVMDDAHTVWNPLLDRLVVLWLSTYVDGWPCQQWPETWSADRAAWLVDFRAAAANHRASRHLRERAPFTIMREALERCPVNSGALSPREVGRLRKAVDDCVKRWGRPGSEAHTETRAQQRAWASLPKHSEIAGAVGDRLGTYAADAGVPDLAPVIGPVQLGGTDVAVPPNVVRKAERALEAPVGELVERGVIGSAEVLAAVLPQITSQVAAAGIEDHDLQTLYAQLYQAFRRRRSLLLLDLEHQVRIEELPWVAALDRCRAPSQAAQRSASQTLRQATALAITSFPQTILPNRLVRELEALADHAGIEIPFVEELAADIFMGTFTTKWHDAARIAAEMLEGSLYARYYDLPTLSTWTQLPPPDRGLFGRGRDQQEKRAAEDFARIYRERSKEVGKGVGHLVARNGTVLELGQILTTHNLAPLVHTLGLSDQLASDVPRLTSDVFGWIIRRQTVRRPDWRSQLQMLKDTAYAWRQALFLLSLADEPTQSQVIDGFRDQWSSAPAKWRDRFEPVLVGLEGVFAGARFDETGRLEGGRRFLGWSVGPHWLAAEHANRLPGRPQGPGWLAVLAGFVHRWPE